MHREKVKGKARDYWHTGRAKEMRKKRKRDNLEKAEEQREKHRVREAKRRAEKRAEKETQSEKSEEQ